MAPTLTLVPAVSDEAALVAVPVFDGRRLAERATVDIDVDALAVLGFEGKVGEVATLAGGGGAGLVAIGMGKPEDVTTERLRRAAASAIRAAWKASTITLTLLEAVPDGLDMEEAAEAIAEGVILAAYRFTAHKSDPKPCQLTAVELVGKGSRTTAAVRRGEVIAGAVSMARDLVNEPPGVVTPKRLADVATAMAEAEPTLSCEIWDEGTIEAEKLGGLLGVSRGSAQPPRLIRMEWAPRRSRGTVAIVGKGITFDSGGLSLKTAQGMTTMKDDMSGAAAVLAVMSVLAVLKPSVRVIGIIPATENLPGPHAIKPGDVLRIRNGKTVEVLNTDAEGRLVLADGLSLAVEAGVDAIVDLATLTGACVVALGPKIAGLMGNNDAWLDEVRGAADRAGEPTWPLPLPDDYRKSIESPVADIKNIGDPAGGGALAAGLFLKEFVENVPWAHLDIAGPAWTESEEGYFARGATAAGVRTMIELLTSGTIPRKSGRRAITA